MYHMNVLLVTWGRRWRRQLLALSQGQSAAAAALFTYLKCVLHLGLPQAAAAVDFESGAADGGGGVGCYSSVKVYGV